MASGCGIRTEASRRRERWQPIRGRATGFWRSIRARRRLGRWSLTATACRWRPRRRSSPSISAAGSRGAARRSIWRSSSMIPRTCGGQRSAALGRRSPGPGAEAWRRSGSPISERRRSFGTARPVGRSPRPLSGRVGCRRRSANASGPKDSRGRSAAAPASSSTPTSPRRRSSTSSRRCRDCARPANGARCCLAPSTASSSGD